MQVCIRRCIGFIALFLMTASIGLALELGMPIDCDYGEDCFIQNYVDLDPTNGKSDYECGVLTYDGHKGTDFRVPWADYLRGVEVRAAAAGVVLRVRDGIPDRDVSGDYASVKNKEIGNGVILVHPEGFTTIYAHLKRGSVRVKPGDKVKQGQTLGLVGLSGLTVFPHLHLGVKYQDNTVCPFKGVSGSFDCGVADKTLWAADTLANLNYISTGLLMAGFTATRPRLSEFIRTEPTTTLPSDAPVLIYAVAVFGVQPGDEMRLRIISPQGKLLTKNVVTLDKHQAQRMQYVGKRNTGADWPVGVYRGGFHLVRDGKQIMNVTREIQIR